MILLSAKNIHKSFSNKKNKQVDVITGVDFSLESNKITVIVGESGAGKSTLLHILSGLDGLDKGEVLIKDTDIARLNDNELSKFRNQHIGFIFQFYQLLPEFTALENIAIPRMIAGEKLKNITPKAEELLKVVGLSERAEHKPAELSGGEQQRVAIARALINNPEIIFADEPTGNLDSKNSSALHQLFVELKDKLGLTFLIVTHNPELVSLADIVYEMKDGLLERRD
ncbi:MAG: ABC transporter ATP-binding protein [Bacteroidetes bacterium]|nr:ABC transporter ATP-binding protein [Bacteroidota bacterium]